MGEEKKENSGGHSIKEDKEKQKDNNEIIVIKVDMLCHCEACAKKIARAVRASQGVEDVAVDRKTNMVVVKGKTAEPMKLCDRIRHKTGRNAHLLSPLPKSPEEQPKDDNNKDQHQEQQQQQQKADQPPPVVTVVLGVHMHCEACAQLLRKHIRKLKGVESVETDVEKGEVKVKGVIADAEILVKYVHKKTNKQVSLLLVNSNNNNNNKDDNNQQAKGKGKGKGKPQDNISREQKNINKAEQDNVDDNTSGVVKNDSKMMMLMMGESETNSYDNYNNSYWPSSASQSHHSHYDNYQQPQFFNDENPNACSIM